jgi:hypothetical protein
MQRLIPIILSLLVVTKSFGQDSSPFMSYHLGFNINYIGGEKPDFVLPVGFGIGITGTLNKLKILKPTFELSAVAFPEYVIHFNGNNNSDDSKYAIGVYNLLVGAKCKLNHLAKLSLTVGPSYNSRGNEWLPGVKPAFELNSKNDKILVQLYYLKIINSEVMNGFTGLAVLFKIR